MIRSSVLRRSDATKALVMVAASLVAGEALAQNWSAADADWVPLTQQGVGIGDPLTDSNTASRNIVGASGPVAQPAAFFYRDTSYFYFRLRMDGDPGIVTAPSGSLDNFGWGVAINTDSNTNNYEYLLIANGKNIESVQLWANTNRANGADDDAEALIKSTSFSTGNIRVSLACNASTQSICFNNTNDYFLDFAVATADFATPFASWACRSGGNPCANWTGSAPPLPTDANTKLSFIFGVGADGTDFQFDIGGTSLTGGVDFDDIGSDAFCGGGTGATVCSDLNVGLTDSRTTIAIGVPRTYTLTLLNEADSDGNIDPDNNAGTPAYASSPLYNVGVTESFSHAVTDASWICVASSGATCAAAAGTGALPSDLGDIGVNASLTFSVRFTVNGAPSGATFSYTVASALSDIDASDDSASDADVVIVPPPNSAPQITSTASATIDENTTFAKQVTATDADNDTLVFSITGGAQATDFLISPSGALSFAVAPDYEPAAGSHTYEVVVTVDDGNGGQTSQTITITVQNVNEAPAITSVPSGSVVENTLLALTVTASDPDGDTPSFALIGSDDDALFSIDSNTGQLLFLTAPSFESPADVGGDNTYTVTVEVTANGQTTQQTIVISVTNANEPPVFATAPTATIAENTTAVTTLSASDPDGDPITYTINGGADAARFQVTGGVLTFTSAPDFELPADQNGDNVYQVIVAATANGQTTLLTLLVTVTNVAEGGPDSDGDGLDDAAETILGTNPNDGDSDDDGVPDSAEPSPGTDTDGDGLINARDADSDGDGVRDGTELGYSQPAAGTDVAFGQFIPDADPNTKTDPLLADTDSGGVSDGDEDTNKNGRVDAGERDPLNPADDSTLTPTDTDGDGLSDDEERAFGLDPNDADSDDDGVADGSERDWNVDTDNDGAINARDPDADNDGLYDGTEMGITTASAGTDTSKGRFVPDADPSTTTNPLNADTDHGGVTDGNEDINRNGRIDAGESDPNVAPDTVPPDSDGDGLSDAVEQAGGLDPNDADNDDDGVPDGAEPNPFEDTDGDGLINAKDSDSDGDGLFDGTELGYTTPGAGTDVAAGFFVPDADPSTRTSPILADTDGGGVPDGIEDVDHNGRIDAGETDPRNATNDVPDADADGLAFQQDNCPADSNADQADLDSDGLGDACDTDKDGDGFYDTFGVCGGACSAAGPAHLWMMLGALLLRRRRRWPHPT